MNCQEFAEVVVELSRGLVADEGARERGLAHSDSCARCAARLAAERTLCAGLRAAAKATAEESAPPRVETALLSAFRARHAAALDSNNAPTHAATFIQATTDAPTNNPSAYAQTATQHVSQTAAAEAASNVYSLEEAAARSSARKSSHASLEASRYSGWWLRVAAALLVAVTAGMTARLVWKSEQKTDARLAAARQASGGASGASRAGVTAEESRTLAAPATSPATTNAVDLADTRSASANYQSVAMPDATAGDEDPRAFEATPAAEARRPTAAPQHAARVRGANRLSRSALGALVANSRSDGASEAEITTDYFPLSGASAMPTMEGGHVVRVELPRAALLSFGLPVNAEQTSGRVKADVLIGHDGMARAIRFVR